MLFCAKIIGIIKKMTEKQKLQLSIEEKSRQIELLQVVSRAIKNFQEKKNNKNESWKLNELEDILKEL